MENEYSYCGMSEAIHSGRICSENTILNGSSYIFSYLNLLHLLGILSLPAFQQVLLVPLVPEDQLGHICQDHPAYREGLKDSEITAGEGLIILLKISTDLEPQKKLATPSQSLTYGFSLVSWMSTFSRHTLVTLGNRLHQLRYIASCVLPL